MFSNGHTDFFFRSCLDFYKDVVCDLQGFFQVFIK
jgi:hypothetical protein